MIRDESRQRRIDFINYQLAHDQRLSPGIALALRFVRDREVSGMGVGEVALHATLLQDLVFSAIQPVLTERDRPAPIDPESIAQTIAVLGGADRVLITKRHFKQRIHESIAKLSPTDQKIAMMRRPLNEEDSLTNASFAESFGTAFALFYILSSVNKLDQTRILTSSNRRAAVGACTLSAVLRVPVREDVRLACPNYRLDKTPDELDEMLGIANKGSLVWEEPIVDNVCETGTGTFRRITSMMYAFVAEGLAQPGVLILEGHTQHTNALDIQAGRKANRWREGGYNITTPTGQFLFKNGLYVAA